MPKLCFTILGCGSSGGVPRLGGHWGDCDPENIKNRRRRCSLLVEKISSKGTTSLLIDTSPDLRDQLLDANIGVLDGIIYTHFHADHVHGIDDLRMIAFNMKKRLPVWADSDTGINLKARFAYAFEQTTESAYPPILDLNLINSNFDVSGPGGNILCEPFLVNHGNINALGYKIGPLAYLPDVSEMTKMAWQAIRKTECWILDALRRTPHPSHTHLEKSLYWIRKSKVKSAVLTNMHIDMDYDTLLAELPEGTVPAYDGMKISFEIE